MKAKLLILLSIFMVGGAVVFFLRRDQDISPGYEFVAGNVGLTVLSAKPARLVGPIQSVIQTPGAFYVVQLKISNHSQVLSYQFDPDKLKLHEGRQGRHPLDLAVSAMATKAWLQTRSSVDGCLGEIPAASSCITEIVFEAPGEITEPYLEYRTGFLWDTLAPFFLGRKRIKLF